MCVRPVPATLHTRVPEPEPLSSAPSAALSAPRQQAYAALLHQLPPPGPETGPLAAWLTPVLGCPGPGSQGAMVRVGGPRTANNIDFPVFYCGSSAGKIIGNGAVWADFGCRCPL